MIKRCLQHWAPWLSAVLLATAASVAPAQTPGYILEQNVEAIKPLPAGRPAAASAPQAASGSASAPQGQPLPVDAAFATARVRIGLLLPLSSASLGEAAAVVRDGFEAARRTEAAPDVAVTELALDNEANAPAAYRELLARGANVVVGPLTRTGIAALAPRVSVPTLALNSFDAGMPPNPKLYSLSLNVDAEARQLARTMQDDGRKMPLVLFRQDGLSARLKQAFVEEWKLRGAVVPQELDVAGADEARLGNALAQADAVFLALDVKEAAAVRARLPADLPAYATSLVNSLEPQPALAGVRFVDMPWLLMPEHPVVQRYPRPATRLTLPTERLYALGVDAYRLAVQLATAKAGAPQRLSGVTGELAAGKDRQFQRTLPLWVVGTGAQ